MDEHFERGQAAGLAIASATRNNSDLSQVAELVTREFADLGSPQAAATCVGTLAEILTQHFHAAIKPDHVTDAAQDIAEAIRVALAERQTGEQLTDSVLGIVANLNRNELAATLATFVVAHFHLDPESEQ